MGMDVMGMSPKNSDGEYFRANLWSWRPIHAICNTVIDIAELNLSTEGWGHNDGNGLKTQAECDQLADAIEAFLKASLEDMEHPDRFYLCLGLWSVIGGQFVSPEVTEQLNEQYTPGTVLQAAVIASDGTLVEPAHSVSLGHVENFVRFLRNCGGFEIY